MHLAYPYQQKLAEKGIEGVTDDLESMLLNKLNEEVDWKQPYDWFDPEVREVLGINLFTTDFDVSAGYGIVSQGNTDVLLIKLESLSDCAEQAFEVIPWHQWISPGQSQRGRQEVLLGSLPEHTEQAADTRRPARGMLCVQPRTALL